MCGPFKDVKSMIIFDVHIQLLGTACFDGGGPEMKQISKGRQVGSLE